MGWKVEFYSIKVEKSIEEWPVYLRVKFLQVVDLLKEFGPYETGMPHIKPLKQGLSEIRVRGLEGIARAPFCVKKGKIVIVLSEFIKKTQEMPQKEVDLALRRMKEVKSDE